MTRTELQKLVGLPALWDPGARAAAATLRVAVTIAEVRQICGRPECCIHPASGSGTAWVCLHTLTIKHPPTPTP